MDDWTSYEWATGAIAVVKRSRAEAPCAIDGSRGEKIRAVASRSLRSFTPMQPAWTDPTIPVKIQALFSSDEDFPARSSIYFFYFCPGNLLKGMAFCKTELARVALVRGVVRSGCGGINERGLGEGRNEGE